jgi:hypothetical protein
LTHFLKLDASHPATEHRSITERGWHRTFDDPIPLPDGGELIGV